MPISDADHQVLDRLEAEHSHLKSILSDHSCRTRYLIANGDVYISYNNDRSVLEVEFVDSLGEVKTFTKDGAYKFRFERTETHSAEHWTVLSLFAAATQRLEQLSETISWVKRTNQ